MDKLECRGLQGSYRKLLPRRRKVDPHVRIATLLSTAFALVIALIALYGLRCLSNGYMCNVYMKNAPLTRAFDGPVGELVRTVVVPTLETPVPARKNVVWTAAPAIAWRDLRRQIGRSALATAHDKERSAQLDRAADVDHASHIAEHYSYLGPAAQARGRIAEELPQALPDSSMPEIPQSSGFLAVSYLRVNVAFPLRMGKDYHDDWWFTDSRDHPTPASFFAIPPNGRQSLRILHADSFPKYGGFGKNTIVDPSPDSTPYQLVLARVPLGESLASTLADAEAKIARFAQEHDMDDWPFADGGFPFSAPSVYFRIRDHRAELATLGAAGNGEERVDVQQTIELELNQPTPTNRSAWLSTPSDFPFVLPGISFNGPFLLYVRQRGTQEPFIVIWLDNNELISFQPKAWPAVLRAFW
jgi:hypothetical protein